MSFTGGFLGVRSSVPIVGLKRTVFPNLRHRVEPYDINTYLVYSLTAPKECYVVDLNPLARTPPERPRCPCKGWQIREWCTHCDSAISFHFRQMFPMKMAVAPNPDLT